jgi:hypothetical protein
MNRDLPIVLVLDGNNPVEARLPAGCDRWQWFTTSLVLNGVSMGVRAPGVTTNPLTTPLQRLGGVGNLASAVNANPGPDTYLRFTGTPGERVIIFVSWRDV